MRCWQLHILSFVIFQNVLPSESVEVSTPLGKVLGTTLTTRLGKTFYAFRGIRYAKPPINDLRFKFLLKNGADGPVCPQPTRNPVSEDCLLLNVYTAQLPGSKENPKLPVILHLHPGGFYSGTGRSHWGGPQYFLDQNIVLITVNYRLGSLGFISVGKEAPGNLGLKDQVMAMRWVKNNVAAFGGDPNSVTLYGYSAGARSVTLHLVSPMSKNLFHKAIIGSGSALGHWPLPNQQLNIAKRQARIVGCPDTNAKEIIDCLKTISAIDLGNSLSKMPEFGFNPVLLWSPVIEDDFGQERFLHDNPVKLIQEGKFMNIPVVAGVTKDEFANMAFRLVENVTLLQELSNNFEKYAPICFIYERGTNKSTEVSRRARNFYLRDCPLTNDSLPGLAKLYADSVTGFPVNRAITLLSEKNTKPVYYYEFTYQGRYSHFYLPGTNTPYGVVHHDELIYTFYISRSFPLFNSSFPEREMVDTLTLLWATFAATGNPIDSKKKEFKGVEWTPYNTNTKKYLDIGKKLLMREKLFEERYNFWHQLYPL